MSILNKVSVIFSAAGLLLAINHSVLAATEKANSHANSDKPHWTHSGDSGPSKWAGISSDFALCGSGKRQSPIDVIPTDSKSADLYSLNFDYQDIVLQAINNGHTVQANYYRREPERKVAIDGKDYQIAGKHHYDSSLLIGDDKYSLLQFHYHSPSEHQLASQSYVMEVHLVHQNSAGNLAVIGVMLKLGEKSTVLQKLLSNVSEQAGPAITKDNITINAHDLLPENKTVFHYSGSLTTPPCSENVNWYLMANSKTVSQEQLNKFQRLIGENSRPIQPINWRTVLVSP